MQHVLKFFAPSQFFETAPVLGAGGVLDLLFHRSEVKLLTLAGANIGACGFAFDRIRFVLFDAHRSFLISRAVRRAPLSIASVATGNILHRAHLVLLTQSITK